MIKTEVTTDPDKDYASLVFTSSNVGVDRDLLDEILKLVCHPEALRRGGYVDGATLKIDVKLPDNAS